MRDESPGRDGTGDIVKLSSSDPALDLVGEMRMATQALHVQAERSGFVQEVLRGRAGRAGYALFLRNLLPVYRALEAGLQRHRHSQGIGRIVRPELFRAAAIEQDLMAMSGPAWVTIDLLPAGDAYARQVSAAADGDGSRLIGHAYTRYLGDLSGAQVLRRLLAKDLRLGPETLSLYDFPSIPDQAAFKTAYRLALNEAGRECADAGIVVREAAAAFDLNIRLSEAVQAAGAAMAAMPPARPTVGG